MDWTAAILITLAIITLAFMPSPEWPKKEN